jgi:hypothetical protein
MNIDKVIINKPHNSAIKDVDIGMTIISANLINKHHMQII